MLLIPLTVLHCNPRASARKVSTSHVAPMYEDGVKVLQILNESLYTHALDNNLIVARWTGSERFVFNLVSRLGDRIQNDSHERYRESFELFPEESNNAPVWWQTDSARIRHIAELMYWDDIERLEGRWINRRRVGIVPDFRPQTGAYLGMTEMSIGAHCALLDDYKGYNPETFTKQNIKTVISTYSLYSTSSESFFRRNRYYRRLPSYRSSILESRKNIQRVLPHSRLVSFLRQRRIGLANPGGRVSGWDNWSRARVSGWDNWSRAEEVREAFNTLSRICGDGNPIDEVFINGDQPNVRVEYLVPTPEEPEIESDDYVAQWVQDESGPLIRATARELRRPVEFTL